MRSIPAVGRTAHRLIVDAMKNRILTIPEMKTQPILNLLGREQGNLPELDDHRPTNLHVLVRCRLSLPEGFWQIQVWAKDHYSLWINGAYRGQGPVPAYPDKIVYDTYAADNGENLLCLHLYYQGLRNRVWNSADGRFGFCLTAVQGDREVCLCPEDCRYTVCNAYSGETVGYDTQFLENFDSALYPEGWQQKTFDDSSWQKTVPALWTAKQMEKRTISNLAEYLLEPVSVTERPDGLLLDFGREITGTMELKAEAETKDRIVISYGEELENENVRWQMRCNCSYREEWKVRPGTNQFHPYDYKAFRYVQLQIPKTVCLTRVAAQVRHYPMPDICRLECWEDQLEQIFEICKNAVRCCTQEGYLDCPSREKGQYLGDAIITAQSQVLLTGSTEMLRKCIRDFAASQKISSTFMAVAPGSLMQEIADFSLLFPKLPLLDYAVTGDKAFLRESYEAVRRMTHGFFKYQRDDGLLENVGELWNLVDWPENLRDQYDFPLTRPIVGSGCHNVVNALWYGANKMQEEIEQILGIPPQCRSRTIAERFQAVFYREDQKLFADSEESTHCSLHANIYPAYFGLLPEQSSNVYEQMLFSGRACGAVPMFFALKSLAKMGRFSSLYRLLTRTDAYGWRNMLSEGATAAFEAWGKEQKWNTSLCHAWNSGPISFLIEDISGFHPDPTSKTGYHFAPPQIQERPDFTMTLPWRGQVLKITQIDHGIPKIERMNPNALSENE